MQKVTTSAHAKVILIGEHAVVYGQPAIALPLKTIQTHVTLQPSSHGQIIHSQLFDGELQQINDRLKGTETLIHTLLTRLATPQQPFTLTITSDIPVERGMGSSAATALAITKAFYAAFQQPINDADLLTTAAISEQVIHGNPSGLDAATDNAQVPLWFVKNQPLRPIALNLQGYLIIADTGIQGQTKEAVSAVRQLMMQHPQTTQAALAKLGTLTKQAATVLKQGNLKQLGTIMNQAQLILKQLTVSSPQLDQLVTVAQRAGAYGSKLTGGGRGGCMLALTDTLTHANDIAHQLRQNGAQRTWIVPLNLNN